MADKICDWYYNHVFVFWMMVFDLIRLPSKIAEWMTIYASICLTPLLVVGTILGLLISWTLLFMVLFFGHCVALCIAIGLKKCD